MKSSRNILFLCLLPISSWAFVAPVPSTSSLHQCTQPNNSLLLSAKKTKKKQRSSTSGEGFGTKSSPSPSAVIEDDVDDNGASRTSRALQSIDNPTAAAQNVPSQDLDLDPNLSPEERSQEILRQKFGLKSYEEQQADMGDARALFDAEKKKKTRNKLRNMDKIWPEDKGVIEVLPPGLIKGVDTFLKVGLGVCTVTFIIAGILITIEAGSKATGTELPAGWEEWIVKFVEPNFTPGLGVLLGFSVSLGVFSISLGGSASSTYRENP